MTDPAIDALRARIRTAFRNNPRLTADAAALADLAEPYVILDAPQQADPNCFDGQPLPLGTCRFGGVPDLPATVAWPQIEGKYLLFLGQIDFSTLPRWESNPLPPDGWMYAFAMFSTKEHVGLPPWKIIVLHYRGPREALVRAEQPPIEQMWPEWGGDPVGAFEVVRLEPRLGLSMPGDAIRAAGLENHIDYVIDDIERVIPSHDGSAGGYLLGHPGTAEESSASAMVRDLEAYDAWPGEDEANAADDWISLLTFFGVGSMQWSDAGAFYLFIRRSDLARGDFSRVRSSMTSG
jgi:hypothetical protein